MGSHVVVRMMKEMEESRLSLLLKEGEIRSVSCSMSTSDEIIVSSISGCPISHVSQLGNPFLGLPLQSGKCESCGASEHGQCEGHFGYIELPIPIYNPSHVSELKHILSLVCLKCLRPKKGKVLHNQGIKKSPNSSCSTCQDVPALSIKEVKATDGAVYLELRLPSRSRLRDGIWKFLDKYGFRYGGDTLCRTLLPVEAQQILKSIPEETKKRLAVKGYCTQNGYILQVLPVPPNCLSVPEICAGTTVMSMDLSTSMLRKVLNKVEIIKRSRSGTPNFESHEFEANDLQSAVAQYMHLRGTTKAPRGITRRFGVGKEADDSSTKAWLEKMRTLFIRKGSGFSSRSVLTGDAYNGINEIGLPLEIAQKITFEERVTAQNVKRLQSMVDHGLCITYRDGLSTYAIKESSKVHASLKVGQVINRRIVDGDIVFINRPPSTHKHSLQAFSVYVHGDHTVKINPLVCAPLGADFDGDCVHIFYPQSLAAKAEALELFSVEQQLLSSHSGSMNLQMVNDSLLSLKLMFKTFFLSKPTAQQLAMFASPIRLPQPTLVKAQSCGPIWTVMQIFQSALPDFLDCSGERHIISGGEVLKFEFNQDSLPSSFAAIIASIFSKKGPKEALRFFNLLQPLLMEALFVKGYSISLKDFYVGEVVLDDLKRSMQDVSPLLCHLRSTYNELVELQVEKYLKSKKVPIINFILKSSALGSLIDSKSDSGINKVVQQIGFLGLQLFDREKFYSRALFEDISSFFLDKYPFNGPVCPPEAFGLIRSSFFQGLNPFEELVHSVSSREVLIRSSKGLTEPGTLFKNLMAILRDVVVCYDGTVRHTCSNTVIQFKYGNECISTPSGEPVGVLAATAVSNPAYKAVLDSSQTNSSSWQLMKEILLCKVNFKNDVIDRRVILYFNDCFCGRRYCKERTAYVVQNHLRRVTLKDCSTDIVIEYQKQWTFPGSSKQVAGLIGHIHLDKMQLDKLNRSIQEILQVCQQHISSFRKKKHHLSQFFKKISVFASECCNNQMQNGGELCQAPCLQFSYEDENNSLHEDTIERTSKIMVNIICPILLDTIVRGNPQVSVANIIWIDPDSTSWIGNSSRTKKGELALEVVLEKDKVKQKGDVWRFVLDCCLPVLDLIDTKRSIPYGIQQIQELLGISSAFDQTVQRLSTSMRTISKGLLKEHLLLVASSMTCTGNFIGFNAGGYKAFFRSLKVHVPFTEATLFTPIKCFERAAEKCHMDSLSSIVAACSWGKHVEIGTGTRFQIIWSKKEIVPNEDVRTDAYDFLQLVSASSIEGEVTTSCLGAEIDDLEKEDGNMELTFSPEKDLGFEKPSFDEGAEIHCDLDGNFSLLTNDKVENSSVKSNGWESRTGGKQLDLGNNATLISKSNGWQDWSDVMEHDSNRNSMPMSESNSCQGWSYKIQHSNQKAIATSKPSAWSSWDSDNTPTQPDTCNAWESWKSNSSESDRVKADKFDDMLLDIDRKATTNSTSNGWQCWNGENQDDTNQNATPKSKSNSWQGWSYTVQDSDQNAIATSHTSVWPTWDTDKTSTWPDTCNTAECWKANNSECDTIKAGNFHDRTCWDKMPTKPDTSNRWGRLKSNNAESDRDKASKSDDQNCWDNNLTPDPCNTWGSRKPEGSHFNLGRGSAKSCVWETADKQNAIWQIEKGHSTKSPRDNQGGWVAKGPLTSTRKRLDLFTCEEERILGDFESIMLAVRKIQSSYADGERLSDNDQSYILANVFQYHPNKTAKVIDKIDHFTVDKHCEFSDTRCFYVVSSNGLKQDFSYLKCLENYAKEKYPDVAESFCKKYFWKRPAEGTSRNMQ